MKRIRSKTTVLFLLIMCMIVTSLSLPAYAKDTEEDSATPYYVAMSGLSATLVIGEDGYANCTGKVKIRSGYQAEFNMELQRSSNGTLWSPVKSWQTSGNGTLLLNERYSIVSGYQYRVTVTAIVYDSENNFVERGSEHSN